MDVILNLIQKCFKFENEPMKIGLSQFKEPVEIKQEALSIKNKDVKLSDLMRRAN